jgi:hypothetical protein
MRLMRERLILLPASDLIADGMVPGPLMRRDPGLAPAEGARLERRVIGMGWDKNAASGLTC